MKKTVVVDYTLSALAHGRGAELLFREKTAVAACMDAVGMGAVELAPVRRPKEDTIIYKTISSGVKNATVTIPAGDSEETIDAAWECVRGAKDPCLQIALPVSTVTMEYGYHMKEAKMADFITRLCTAAKAKCPKVEFAALDATRADVAFLCKAAKCAADAGAQIVTLCDDAGRAMPEEIASLVKYVKESCGADVYVRPSDAISMGAACAAAAIRAGASGVKVAVAGDDALNTVKFAKMLEARGEEMGVATSLKLTELYSDVASLLRGVEAAHPSDTAERENDGDAGIYLHAESTAAQVSEAARKLGYTLSAEDDGKVYDALMDVCARKGSVGAAELEAIIASNAMQAPSAYHLESYNITSSNITSAMASVAMVRAGEKSVGVATGDGPIDAAFRAIEQCVGHHYEMDAFQIRAVTQGKEALGDAVVRLRSGGKLFSGNGLSTDIVGASIRAYVNALNKIIFEEEQA